MAEKQIEDEEFQDGPTSRSLRAQRREERQKKTEELQKRLEALQEEFGEIIEPDEKPRTLFTPKKESPMASILRSIRKATEAPVSRTRAPRPVAEEINTVDTDNDDDSDDDIKRTHERQDIKYVRIAHGTGPIQLGLLKPFKGKRSENLVEWLLTFERHARMHSWKAKTKRLAVLSLLEDSALIWSLAHNVEETCSTYEQLKDCMITAYLDATYIESRYKEYRDCSWRGRKTESIQEYGYRMMHLCTQLSILGRPIDTEQSIVDFIHGLRWDHYERILLYNEDLFPATLEDAIRKAERIDRQEQALQSRKNRREEPKREKKDTQEEKKEETEPDARTSRRTFAIAKEVCTRCGHTGHEVSTCFSRIHKITKERLPDNGIAPPTGWTPRKKAGKTRETCATINGTNTLYVNGVVNNIHIPMAVDTQSSVSIVDENFWREHLRTGVDQKGIRFQVANKSSLMTRGSTLLAVTIGLTTIEHDFQVAPIPMKILLGHDFLTKIKASTYMEVKYV